MPWPHATRDLLLLLATAGLWWVERSLAGAPGALPVALGVVTGAATALCGYLLHEWGHLCAARLSGSAVALPRSPREVFLFRFDVERNRPRHFIAMSCGGFLATALVVSALLLLLPADGVARNVTLGLTALGVVATLVSEMPPFFKVVAGGPLPRGSAYVSSEAP